MYLAGIDYSMTSPCICIYDTNMPLLFKNCRFFVYSNTKTRIDDANIEITPQRRFTCNEERFDNISTWACEKLSSSNVKLLGLEGYSYGSTSSRLFDIGENGGLLKHKLWKAGIQFELYAPGAVKKFFAGKGNANKDAMYSSIKEKESIYIGDSSDSPVSDIVDSYAILSFFVYNHPDHLA